MKIGVFGKRGLAGLQVWLMVFGFVGFVFMMGVVSGGDSGEGDKKTKFTLSDISSLMSLHNGFGDKHQKTTTTNTPTSGYKCTDNWCTSSSGSWETGSNKPTGTMQGANSDSMLADFLHLDKGSGASSIASGVQWAVIAYFAGTLLGGALGLSDDNTEALSTALAAGFGVYNMIHTYAAGSGTGAFGSGGWIGGNAGLIGIGVAAVIFAYMYSEEEVEIVDFSCMPWQAPNGGNDCELCNEDDLPCSEYRCKSLGQSCSIVNEGTSEEKCVYTNPRDVTPPIINPNYDVITPGYGYKNVKSSPPGPGFDIVNTESRDGCLKAFTPLEFGITTGNKNTGEASQCKIDFNHTTSYEDMVAYVGGSNLYSYNHSEMFSLPGAKELAEAGFVLENGKDFTFYLRCKDANGNTNEAEYAVNFCVDPTPDATPPKIEATSIANGGCVTAETEEANVIFYVNEPSTCRWSFMDQDYELMTEEMSCSRSPVQLNALTLFECNAVLSGIPRDGVDYYVRCKDQPGKNENDRNGNAESFKFSLRGSNALTIRKLLPNGSVFGGVSPAPIELYVETLYGCNEGKAICKWSGDGNTFIDFFDTDNSDGISTQRLDLLGGAHDYYVKCVDEGGNVVEDVASFYVDIDTSAPVIARVYEEGGMLKVVTVRNSECSYSLENCDFTFSEGAGMPNSGTPVHVVEWNEGNTYYVKCRDEYLNENADCSIIVKPTENFL